MQSERSIADNSDLEDLKKDKARLERKVTHTIYDVIMTCHDVIAGGEAETADRGTGSW